MCNLRYVVKYNLSFKSIFPLKGTQAKKNVTRMSEAMFFNNRIKFKNSFWTPDIELAQRLALSGFNGVKNDLILILTLQRIVAPYHIKQNATRGSTNCVCLLVRRLTINNYLSDVIRMWPEADNYHNLITEEPEPWVRAMGQSPSPSPGPPSCVIWTELTLHTEWSPGNKGLWRLRVYPFVENKKSCRN